LPIIVEVEHTRRVKTICNRKVSKKRSRLTSHLNFTINPVSLMKVIIEREATFEDNSEMVIKVIQKQLSRAFVKETQ